MDFDIHTYGNSFKGHSHVTNGKPLQDSSANGKINDRIAYIIVADGVGSSKHSEDASRIAVEEIVHEIMYDGAIITEERLASAYDKSLEAIEKFASENSNDISDYDTTLSVAIFDAESGSILYGHSGDGGIIAIRKDGYIESITEPQKGFEATSVIPLRQKNAWKFGKKEGPYVAVLAVTDGMLDQLMPGRLKLTDEHIYIRLVSWFADYKFFNHEEDLQISFEKRLNYVSKTIFDSTSDDLSLVVAMNLGEEAAYVSDDYYKEPDWISLEEEWKKKAYPNLFKPADVVDSESKTKPITAISKKSVKRELSKTKQKQREKNKRKKVKKNNNHK